jgi:hypothetical protein
LQSYAGVVHFRYPAKMSLSRQFVILSLFLLAGFIAYSNILNSWFISDDFSQVGKILAGDLSVV